MHGKARVERAFSFFTLPAPAMGGTQIICSSHLSGQFLLQLGTLLDDGNPQTGTVRAIDETALRAATAGTVAAVQGNPGGNHTAYLIV